MVNYKAAYLRVVNHLRHLFQGRLEHWQDPQVVGRKNEEHHVPLRLLADEREALEALEGPRGESEWVRFIATVDKPARCRFKLYKNPKSCPAEAVAGLDEAEMENWEESLIPSNWQFEEPHKDPPIYTNISFPWKRGSALSTAVPTRDNPTGCYRVSFDLPQAWLDAVASGKRTVFLILHGAGPGVDIYVNGKHVGYGQDSMTETEVAISTADLRATGNSLTMVVYRWTDGSYMEDQDQWWLSGVFRDVELSCRLNAGGLGDYIVRTTLEPDSAAKQAFVTVHARATGPASAAGTVRASLFDAKRNLVVRETAALESGRKFGDEKLAAPAALATLVLSVEDPRLWQVQDPYLYSLVLEVVDEAGAVVQVESTRVGVRTVCIKDAQVHVNGEPILVCGVNRHEWDDKAGKVIREETMVKDIKLMKQFNFNAVRNCHYPNAHRWYELCDQYGLFVIDEANIETHGFAKVAHISLLQQDSRWKKAFLSRVQALVRRTRNHPSIIGWSLGNESGSGANMRACAKWVRDVDPTRTLQYEGGINSGDSPMLMGDGRDPYCTDIICPMYDSPLLMAKIEAETTRASGHNRARPMILCEYAHAMGNSNGNLHLYWKLFRSPAHPKMQGGFIWDWVDQGLSLPDFMDGGWGYGGDFGPTSGAEDKTFCINGLIFPDRTPHPGMFEAKFLQRPMTFSFDLASQAANPSFEAGVALFPHAPLVEHLEFGYEVFGISQEAPLAKGAATVEPPSGDAAPRSLSLSLAQAGSRSREATAASGEPLTLVLTARLAKDLAWARKGHEVATEAFPLDGDLLRKMRPSFESTTPESLRSGKMCVTELEDGKVLRVQGASYVAVFDLGSGSLVSLADAAERPVLEGEALSHCFFRASTDNDLGGLDSMLPNELLKPFVTRAQTSLNGMWRKLGLDALTTSLLQVSSETEDDSEAITVVVTQKHCHKRSRRFTTRTRFTFAADAVLLDVTVDAAKATISGTPSLPRVGMELVLPGSFDRIEYLGRGAHETYPDRKASGRMGVYSTAVDDMHTPYINPSECGGRADVQWVRAVDAAAGTALRVQYMFPESDPVRREFFDGMDLSKTEGPATPRPAGMCGAQMSASRYTVSELDVARHQCELPAVDASSPVHLHVDTAHQGLGGDVSWMPKLHDQYRVHGSKWRYKLLLSLEPATASKRSSMPHDSSS